MVRMSEYSAKNGRTVPDVPQTNDSAAIDPMDKSVSRVLRELLYESPLYQKQVSAMSGIAPRTLMRVLNGQRPATFGEVRLLAGVFNTTVAKIATEAEWLLQRD